ncbi:MAG: methyltransferase domain-containing protein [Pseudomonadota bacterium]
MSVRPSKRRDMAVSVNPTEIQERFESVGPEYFWLEVRYSLTRWLLRRFSAAHARCERRVDLLDLGCGPGNCLRGLPHWIRCFGSDLDLEALRTARVVSGAQVFVSDASEISLKSGSLDFVVMLDVAEHVREDRKVFSEASRVLRPGGICIVTAPAHQLLWGSHDEVVGHFRRYSRRDLVGKLRANGFELLEKRYLLPVTFFSILGLRLWKRLRKKRTDDFFRLSPAVSSLVTTFLFLESTVSRFFPFFWGAIVYAVARKPAGEGPTSPAGPDDPFESLACPRCKSGLRHRRDLPALDCVQCSLRYEIVDDIPVMLVERARAIA